MQNNFMQLVKGSPAIGEEEEDHDLMLSAWFRESRHVETIVGEVLSNEERDNWRKFVRERMKTVSVALVLCLNIGVDPPDVAKPNPCAKLECWIDPLSTQSQKAMDKIGAALQKQYERWQPRARYKVANDPTVEEVKKLCSSMRRNAKEERVLFHYNGHGVPRPTENGEIWVFNKNFTQYIPLSIYDLQAWMGHPSVYVWDCNSAGTVVKSFNRFAIDHEREWNNQFDAHRATLRPPLPVGEMTLDQQADATGFRRPPNYRECIQLAACQEGELLPTNPDMPADLFTSTLTTPIKTSVLWYIAKNGVKDRFPANIVDQIPGQLNDRRTLLGELNWIFTAITDTIAWNTLPRELFQKLFRQDLLVASLFRNFLLADRLMRAHNCRPLSSPSLPATADHPLWESWDYTLDLCLSHLQRPSSPALELAPSPNSRLQRISSPAPTIADYTHSPFFIDQLQAFDVWLEYGVEEHQPPQQLPVVLQVLLSQVHRVRALELLSRFLDLGSWAVGFALSVGIFPYVLKLLQSDTKELRPWLSFIWAKILAVDPACQSDLVKDNGFIYFIKILNDPTLDARKKIVPAFVTATLIENCYRPGQEALTQNNYVTICMELLSDGELSQCPMLRLWLLIGMGRLWADCNDARWQAVRLVAYDRVAHYLADPVPEVRASAIYALGSLISNRSENNEHATQIDHQISLKLANESTYDGSTLVRAELAVALHWFVLDFEDQFATLVYALDRSLEVANWDSDEDRFNSLPRGRPRQLQAAHIETVPNFHRSLSTNQVGGDVNFSPGGTRATTVDLYNYPSAPTTSIDRYQNRITRQIDQLAVKTFTNAYETIWLVFLRLAVDPMPEVAKCARTVVDHISKQAAVVAAKTAEKLALKKTPKKTASKDDSQMAQRPPMFVVGSPANHAIVPDPDAASNSHQSPQPTVSVGRHARFPSADDSEAKANAGPTPSFHPILFTPKRKDIFGPGPVRPANEPAPTKKALIGTEFVAWCSKRFAMPLLDTLKDSNGDGVNDRMVTKAAASDWAHHVSDALTEHADRELARLARNPNHRLETQKFVGRNQRPASALAFSHLRPHLCAADARTVTVWDWERAAIVKGFLNHEVNSATPDSLSFLETINPMTAELLITATSRGVLRIWDTGLNSETGQETAKLVTAAHLVKDIPRLTDSPTTVYHWEQDRGILLAAGDMRVCRLWDAHSERKIQDLAVGGGSKCVVTSVSADIGGSQLVALGCNDGSVLLYDVRLPANECRITTLRHLQMSVVKAYMVQHDSKVRLVAGSIDGHVRVWEPRMYQDPVTSVSVSSQGTAQLLAMNVQSNGRLIACATTAPAVKIFDLEGKALSAIRYHDGIMGTRLGEVASVAFHPYRLSLAVASRDSYVAVYGMP